MQFLSPERIVLVNLSYDMSSHWSLIDKKKNGNSLYSMLIRLAKRRTDEIGIRETLKTAKAWAISGGLTFIAAQPFRI
jgi:hypothetical protein